MHTQNPKTPKPQNPMGVNNVNLNVSLNVSMIEVKNLEVGKVHKRRPKKVLVSFLWPQEVARIANLFSWTLTVMQLRIHFG